ncbi:hypothetical protein HYALB_00002186 [Hymenoscyphus albidus]|uniref:Secreted protein n=1 Tax=Hymenoscyphus albidus TaxID=595503 RepID=A0A9N9Q4U2_9HELO|nr:hypothetical protein HYALB_00002186 [Hymenoscyphus albidus]
MPLCKIHFATLLMAILGFAMMILANPIRNADIELSRNTIEACAKDAFVCNWYSNKDAAEEGLTRSNIDTLTRQGTCHVEPFHKSTPEKTEECTVQVCQDNSAIALCNRVGFVSMLDRKECLVANATSPRRNHMQWIPVVNIWPATLKTSSIELIVGMALWLKDQGTIPTDILLRLRHVDFTAGFSH